MDFLSKEGGRLQFGLQRLGLQMWAHSRVGVGLGVAKATLFRGDGRIVSHSHSKNGCIIPVGFA